LLLFLFATVLRSEEGVWLLPGSNPGRYDFSLGKDHRGGKAMLHSEELFW